VHLHSAISANFEGISCENGDMNRKTAPMGTGGIRKGQFCNFDMEYNRTKMLEWV